MIYNKITLIGLGLIASSMFWATKRTQAGTIVHGFDHAQDVRETARAIGLCDVVCDSAIKAVQDADLVVLCVPVGAMGTVMAEIGPHLKPGATLSDVGSVKMDVIAAVRKHLPHGVHFIPGHPLAGTEHSGPHAGFAELFDNRWCLLTPLPENDPAAIDALNRYWQAVGTRVECMDPKRHDLVLAVISHVPHLIAYTMVGVADDLKRVSEGEVIAYSAAGFRDFTRIASSDPTMWRDVFLSNKAATLDILGRFTEELFALQRAIRTGDGEGLHDYFTRTRAIRRGIVEAGQDTDAPDFGRFKDKHSRSEI